MLETIQDSCIDGFCFGQGRVVARKVKFSSMGCEFCCFRKHGEKGEMKMKELLVEAAQVLVVGFPMLKEIGSCWRVSASYLLRSECAHFGKNR